MPKPNPTKPTDTANMTMGASGNLDAADIVTRTHGKFTPRNEKHFRFRAAILTKTSIADDAPFSKVCDKLVKTAKAQGFETDNIPALSDRVVGAYKYLEAKKASFAQVGEWDLREMSPFLQGSGPSDLKPLNVPDGHSVPIGSVGGEGARGRQVKIDRKGDEYHIDAVEVTHGVEVKSFETNTTKAPVERDGKQVIILGEGDQIIVGGKSYTFHMPVKAAHKNGATDRPASVYVVGAPLTHVRSKTYSLEDKSEHIIGRHPGSDIQVLHSKVSKRHARIFRKEDGKYYVEDLGSLNGTRIRSGEGEKPLTEARELQEGDVIILGDTNDAQIKFRAPMTAEQKAEARERLLLEAQREYQAEEASWKARGALTDVNLHVRSGVIKPTKLLDHCIRVNERTAKLEELGEKAQAQEIRQEMEATLQGEGLKFDGKKLTLDTEAAQRKFANAPTPGETFKRSITEMLEHDWIYKEVTESAETEAVHDTQMHQTISGGTLYDGYAGKKTLSLKITTVDGVKEVEICEPPDDVVGPFDVGGFKAYFPAEGRYAVGDIEGRIYLTMAEGKFPEIGPEVAEMLMAEVANGDAAGKFWFKIHPRESGVLRRDQFVIYFNSANQADVAKAVQRITQKIGAKNLSDKGPYYTYKLDRGVFFAENPPGGESFGKTRSDVLARALAKIKFFQDMGQKMTPEAKLKIITYYFDKAGIDINDPAFNKSNGDTGKTKFKALINSFPKSSEPSTGQVTTAAPAEAKAPSADAGTPVSAKEVWDSYSPEIRTKIASFEVETVEEVDTKVDNEGWAYLNGAIMNIFNNSLMAPSLRIEELKQPVEAAEIPDDIAKVVEIASQAIKPLEASKANQQKYYSHLDQLGKDMSQVMGRPYNLTGKFRSSLETLAKLGKPEHLKKWEWLWEDSSGDSGPKTPPTGKTSRHTGDISKSASEALDELDQALDRADIEDQRGNPDAATKIRGGVVAEVARLDLDPRVRHEPVAQTRMRKIRKRALPKVVISDGKGAPDQGQVVAGEGASAPASPDTHATRSPKIIPDGTALTPNDVTALRGVMEGVIGKDAQSMTEAELVKQANDADRQLFRAALLKRTTTLVDNLNSKLYAKNKGRLPDSTKETERDDLKNLWQFIDKTGIDKHSAWNAFSLRKRYTLDSIGIEEPTPNVDLRTYMQSTGSEISDLANLLDVDPTTLEQRLAETGKEWDQNSKSSSYVDEPLLDAETTGRSKALLTLTIDTGGPISVNYKGKPVSDRRARTYEHPCLVIDGKVYVGEIRDDVQHDYKVDPSRYDISIEDFVFIPLSEWLGLANKHLVSVSTKGGPPHELKIRLFGPKTESEPIAAKLGEADRAIARAGKDADTVINDAGYSIEGFSPNQRRQLATAIVLNGVNGKVIPKSGLKAALKKRFLWNNTTCAKIKPLSSAKAKAPGADAKTPVSAKEVWDSYSPEIKAKIASFEIEGVEAMSAEVDSEGWECLDTAIMNIFNNSLMSLTFYVRTHQPVNVAELPAHIAKAVEHASQALKPLEASEANQQRYYNKTLKFGRSPSKTKQFRSALETLAKLGKPEHLKKWKWLWESKSGDSDPKAPPTGGTGPRVPPGGKTSNPGGTRVDPGTGKFTIKELNAALDGAKSDFRKGRFNEALDKLETAEDALDKLDGDDLLDDHVSLARLYFLQSRAEYVLGEQKEETRNHEAQHCFSRAKERALKAVQQFMFEKATPKDDAESSANARAHAKALYQLARSELKLNKPEETANAIDALGRAIKLDPKFAEARTLLKQVQGSSPEAGSTAGTASTVHDAKIDNVEYELHTTRPSGSNEAEVVEAEVYIVGKRGVVLKITKSQSAEIPTGSDPVCEIAGNKWKLERGTPVYLVKKSKDAGPKPPPNGEGSTGGTTPNTRAPGHETLETAPLEIAKGDSKASNTNLPPSASRHYLADQASKPWVSNMSQTLADNSEIPSSVQLQIERIAKKSEQSGHEYGVITIIIGERVIEYRDDNLASYYTSGSPKELNGPDAGRVVDYLVPECLHNYSGDTKNEPITIYDFHTHPKGAVYTHEDGRSYTHFNASDIKAMKALADYVSSRLKGAGYTGPIKIVAGAIPTNTGTEGKKPYINVYGPNTPPTSESSAN
jgi:pSer/pThr/pTyr-binding forkhead associated (FHA) protein/tetratricopeptide (TPR) repeat protein